MRFRDIRRSVVKQTHMDQDNRKFTEVATVQRISPYENGNPMSGVRKGVNAQDIIHPTYNREKRRGSGQLPQRKRLRGSIPPHPVKVINQARRIQRNCNHVGEPYENNGLHYCPNCHAPMEVSA